MAHPTIQIQLLVGPGAGRTTSFANSPVSFGREVDNTMVLPEATVSRRHGEIRFENGRWVLTNLSNRSLHVGRRNVTAKPHILSPGDTVKVGDVKLFVVVSMSVGDEDEEVNAPASTPDARQSSARPTSGRARLWLGIAVFIGAIFLIFAVIISLVYDEKNTPK